MTTGIVIPAHMGSTRFPGKPLALVGGKPLLSYAVEAARASGLPWCVATSDDEIVEWCDNQYIVVIKTRDVRNGTERAAVVASVYSSVHGWDRVIVLQCDEPDVTGEDLQWMNRQITDRPFTLVSQMSEGDWGNTNSVAAYVVRHANRQYGVVSSFCRAVMNGDTNNWLRHVGVYVYSDLLLAAYANHTPTLAETENSLEQLRVMAMGISLHACILNRTLRSVNVPSDVEKFTEDARQPVSQS